MRTGIEPGIAAPQPLDPQQPALKIDAVDICDFELAARRGFEAGRDLDDLGVVKIEPGDRPLRPRLPRFFLDANRLAVRVELNHAISFGAADLVGEDGGAGPRLRRLLQDRRQAVAIEYVVAEHQGDIVAADEGAPDQKGLRQSFGARLLGIGNRQAPLAAVPEKRREAGPIYGRRNNEDLADTREHQCRQRVINHRLVVYRQQLLADRQGHRIEPSTGAAGENYSFHRNLPLAGCGKKPRLWPGYCL